MTNDQTETLDWRDGIVPVSRRFDDPYFSFDNGLEETRHVFLAGNDLPDRFRDVFHIAELGFGTGLNMLATAAIWLAAPQGQLHFTSFEAYPLPTTDIARALTHFPQAQALAQPFLAAWDRGDASFDLHGISVTVIRGDARQTLAGWAGHADAWYLDGFSPAKNPQMWEPDLMQQVATHTAPGGTFASYTAAGHVRRSLRDAGFDVARAPGYGRKKHMSRGRLKDET